MRLQGQLTQEVFAWTGTHAKTSWQGIFWVTDCDSWPIKTLQSFLPGWTKILDLRVTSSTFHDWEGWYLPIYMDHLFSYSSLIMLQREEFTKASYSKTYWYSYGTSASTMSVSMPVILTSSSALSTSALKPCVSINCFWSLLRTKVYQTLKKGVLQQFLSKESLSSRSILKGNSYSLKATWFSQPFQKVIHQP